MLNKTETLTVEEYKKNKFGAKKCLYNGDMYASKIEMNYAIYLDTLQIAKEIQKWERQFVISIDINNCHICNYVADFRIFNNDNTIKIVDVKGYVKGTAYQLFKFKKKLIKALYNIEIVIIRKGIKGNWVESI